MSKHDDHDEENDEILPGPKNRAKTIIVDHTALDRYKNRATPSHLIFTLDATLQSTCDWTPLFIKAQEQALQNGYHIVFHLDLGLFDRLQRPLSDQAQFQSFLHSIRYFRKEVLQWVDQEMFGVLFYKGSFPLICRKSHADESIFKNFHDWLTMRGFQGVFPQSFAEIVTSSQSMRWNYRRFCHEECIEYLRELSLEIPDTFHRFIQCSIPSDLAQSDLVIHSARDLLEPIHPILKTEVSCEYLYPIASSLCDFGYSGSEESLFLENSDDILGAQFCSEDSFTVAILLPSYTSILYERVSPLLNFMEILSDQKKAPKIKIVHEPFFTTEWHNIDHIFVLKQTLSQEGIRALRGFEAAGGSIIEIDVEKDFSHFFL